MAGCGVASAAIFGNFFGVVDSVGVLSREQRISKILKERTEWAGEMGEVYCF